MGKRPYRHHSFILSLWLETDNPPAWRYSLEEPYTAERHGFKDLLELVRFLEVWTAVPPPEESPIEK
jgi:hypothetical protein